MTRFQIFEGNLARDPELKTFDDGNSSVRFRLIDNPTRTDRNTGEVIKETPVGVNCVARDPLARNIAESVTKGDRLIVTGTTRTREYTDRDGNRRSADYIAVESAGVSLRFRKSNAAPAEDAPQEPDEAPWPEAVQPGAGFPS